MANVHLDVEVPEDEVEDFLRALVELCFDYGLPVDDEAKFEEDTEPSIDIDPERLACPLHRDLRYCGPCNYCEGQ